MQNASADTANNISIVFEDSDCLVLNKPSGISVHADGKREEYTLVDWVIEKYPEMKEVGEPLVTSNNVVVHRAGIVHRLDKETSGLVLFAKNQEAFLHFKEQFQNRVAKKEYKAFVYGEVKENEGVIDRPIGRSKSDFRLRTAMRGARGEMREAITEYKVEKRAGGFSCLSLFPKTGRTHQLRVHLKAINYPIVCDKLYAPNKPCELGFERLALHAEKLSLINRGGEEVSFEAPLPEDFVEALARMGQ